MTLSCLLIASREGISAHGFPIKAQRCTGFGVSVAAGAMGQGMGRGCSGKGKQLAKCPFGS